MKNIFYFYLGAITWELLREVYYDRLYRNNVSSVN